MKCPYCNNNEIGYIRFMNSKSGGRPSDDIVFFFDEDKKKIDIAYDAIANGISLSKHPTISAAEPP